MKRVIVVSFPGNKFKKIVTVESVQKSPYELVELVRKNLNNSVEEESNYYDIYKLSDIMPIHNLSGLRDLGQIRQMQEKIAQGSHILENDGLPNIKFVVAPNNKLLVFDGSHSLLAYLNAGKKVLSEIPYLVVAGENLTPITVEEMAVFFPERSRSLVTKDWFKYVVNWQAEPEMQLEKRNVNSLAELARELRKRDKSTVE